MKCKGVLFGLFLLVSGFASAAKPITGKVVDSNQHGIEGVAVVLQTADSVFVEAVVTDSVGVFAFQVTEGTYRLLFQHLLYETVQIDVTDNDIGVIQLKETDYQLDEVVIKGSLPQVRVDNGALVYNTPQLIQNKPVNNAFEAIKELPGVSGDDETLALLGAGNLHIVLNGKQTTMSLAQLIHLLKSIPASRVRSTEVMYNAPARFNVKGALINVIIEQDNNEGKSWQGEAGVEYRQRHDASGVMRTSTVYLTPRLSIDFLANGTMGKSFGGEDMFARHLLKDEVVEIDQTNRSRGKPRNGSLRLGVDYQLRNSDQLSVSYYLDANKSNSTRTSHSLFSFLQDEDVIPAFSTTTIKGNSALQNAQFQYKSHTGLIAGVDFTHYRNPEHQRFINESEMEVSTDMLNNSKQDIAKWMAFVNHTCTFKGDWSLNYGIDGSYTLSDTEVDYAYYEGSEYVPDYASRLDDEQIEYGGAAFVEISKKIGLFSATVSLKGEYFKSEYTSNGETSVLWDDLAIFSNASMSYTFSPSHIVQFSLSSDKKYPSYWSVNPQTSYLNAYSVVQGNPSLKPSRSYEGQLLYIIHQKYILMAFAEYTPDYFTQQPYQSDSTLRHIFRYENFDYRLLTGIGVIIPVRIGSRINTRVTIQGMRLQEKDNHYHQISFDNHKYLARIGVNNTVNISNAQPDLKLTFNGYYVSPAIQGIYDLGSSYDVSAGLKWTFANDRAVLSMNYNNIFRSNMPRSIEICTADQFSRMKNLEYSFLNVAFSWKFGGYKEKQREKIDTSRFRK